MAGQVLFAQVLHSHQPVGNFDGVFEWACREAYSPYVEEYLRTGRMPLSLHFSGPLLEWLDEHDHPLLGSLRRAAQECGVEFVGGGWYEPVLTMLPRSDALGQLRGGADLVKRLFGARPRGAWITERVWEQNLASVLVEAGYEYACLDDSHFAHAGFDPGKLGAYYLAEDDGRLLSVFPASERLRYLIPFGRVEEVIEELRRHCPERGRALVVYADDGEKFGLWPGTNKHVYTDGWLARLHAALAAESDWLKPVTLSEALELTESAGPAYLGDDSYREMTEWVLPADAGAELKRGVEALAGDERFEKVRRFFRGGSWRAFKAKYSELRRAYARMLEVSAAVEASGSREARRELYRAQCNCAWWHGVFGGLYLPHLRGAVWNHLLRAERLARKASRGRRRAVLVEDFDLDGREEIRLSSAKLSAFLSPARGGHLFELDFVPADRNLTDVLTRRPEAYHRDIREALAGGAGGGPAGSAGGSASIHELDRQTDREHGDHLVYDRQPLESLVDHLIPGEWSPRDLWRAELPSDEGFRRGEYAVRPGRRKGTRTTLARSGPLGETGEVELVKEIALRGAALEARYSLVNRNAAPARFTFAVELNLSPDFAPPEGGRRRGPEVLFWDDASELVSACPPWQLTARLSAPEAAGAAWAVKTVSQSESGYEITTQGLGLVVWWWLELAPGGRFEKTLTLTVESE